MAIKEMIQNIRGHIAERNEPRPEIPDEMTRDRHLRSLRRESRMIDEKHEKAFLKQKIADERKQELRENVFGVGTTNVLHKSILKTPMPKDKVNILKTQNAFKHDEQHSLLKDGKKSMLGKFKLNR